MCSVLFTKYHSDDQIEKNEIGRACGMYMGDRRDAYMILVGRLKRRRPLGRSRRRWKDNIKMDLKEVEWESWPGLIWLRIETGYRSL